MRTRNLTIASALALSIGISMGACLADEEASPSSPNPAGAGLDGGNTDAPTVPGEATQTGSIVDLDSKVGVQGATVDLGGRTGVTGERGAYAIKVPVDTSFFMTVTGPGHLKLIEQEWKLTGDYDLGKTSFLSTSTSDTLRSTLPGYDRTKATISVGLMITGACTTEEGATFEIDPPGVAQLKYFRGGFPSTATFAGAGQTVPTAVFWNIEPGDNYTIKAKHPTCEVIPYPHSVGTVSYSGRVRGEAGDAASFIRVFLK
jgi:hypothetical protein